MNFWKLDLQFYHVGFQWLLAPGQMRVRKDCKYQKVRYT